MLNKEKANTKSVDNSKLTIDCTFYTIFFALKLVLFVNNSSEMYRFVVEISNSLPKLSQQQGLKRFSYNKDLVLLCQKLVLLTDDTFNNYKYLLNQNIELFLK